MCEEQPEGGVSVEYSGEDEAGCGLDGERVSVANGGSEEKGQIGSKGRE